MKYPFSLRPSWAQRLVLVVFSALLIVPTPLAWAQVAPNRLPNLGDGTEMTLGAERRIGDNIAREIYRDPDYVDDVVLREYVQDIWHKLMKASSARGEMLPEQQEAFAWDVMLIKDRSINAFALPGGYMGVHLGLIGAVNTTDELASVLGHELSHITQRHIARSISQQGKQTPIMLGAMILGMLAASRTASLDAANAATAVMVGGPAAMMQSQLNFSRDMEREADRIGYNVMSDAGYNTMGFVTMFEKLDQASRLNDSGNFPYLRSHPLTTERIADAKARQQMATGQKPQSMSALHAMMSARAQVLVDSSGHNLDFMVNTLAQAHMDKLSVARQVQILYAAILAQIRQHEFAPAQQNIERLAPLVQNEAPARFVFNLLIAELAIAQGHGKKAIDILTPKVPQSMQMQPRSVHLLMAQARLSMHQPAQAAAALEDLQLWVSDHPEDAQAWHMMSEALDFQGQSIRSVRAQAEAFAAQYDYQGAVDRLKAAQQMVMQRQRDNQMSNADQMEASIIDARLHAVQKLAHEQALQR